MDNVLNVCGGKGWGGLYGLEHAWLMSELDTDFPFGRIGNRSDCLHLSQETSWNIDQRASKETTKA